MIYKDCTISINKGVSTIKEPIILYRGDKEVELCFELKESSYKYSDGTNIVSSSEASYSQIVIKVPNNKPPIFGEILETKEGKAVLKITSEMIDEIDEVGLYDFQVRLFDKSKASRITIPPVEKGIEIREPIAIEDFSNEVGIAKVGYAQVGAKGVQRPTLNEDGSYNRKVWIDKEPITKEDLNVLEDIADKNTTQVKESATKKYVDDNVAITKLKNTGTEYKLVWNEITNSGIYSLVGNWYYALGNKSESYLLISVEVDKSEPIMEVVIHGLGLAMLISTLDGSILYENHFATEDSVLKKNNTNEYEPIEDYNPATKKYVDKVIIKLESLQKPFKNIWEEITENGIYYLKGTWNFTTSWTIDNCILQVTQDNQYINYNSLFGFVTYNKTTKELTSEEYIVASMLEEIIGLLPEMSFNSQGELVVTINGVSKTFTPKADI